MNIRLHTSTVVVLVLASSLLVLMNAIERCPSDLSPFWRIRGWPWPYYMWPLKNVDEATGVHTPSIAAYGVLAYNAVAAFAILAGIKAVWERLILRRANLQLAEDMGDSRLEEGYSSNLTQSAENTRTWFRYHLSTAIVLMFVASGFFFVAAKLIAGRELIELVPLFAICSGFLLLVGSLMEYVIRRKNSENIIAPGQPAPSAPVRRPRTGQSGAADEMQE